MEPVWTFEISIINFLQQNFNSLIPIFRVFTLLGDSVFFLGFFLLLYWVFNPRISLRLSIILLISAILNLILKIVFQFPRPFWIDSSITSYTVETSFGMPSGHAQNAMVLWSSLNLFYRKYIPNFITILLILMVGISRIFLGVHFITDVLAGWLIGLLLYQAVKKFDKPFTRWINLQTTPKLILGVSITITILVSTLITTLVFANWPMPQQWLIILLDKSQRLSTSPIDPYKITLIAGIANGFFIGATLLFKNLGGFQPARGLKKQIIIVLIGLIISTLLWIATTIFPTTHVKWVSIILHYIFANILGAWVSIGTPLLSKKLII